MKNLNGRNKKVDLQIISYCQQAKELIRQRRPNEALALLEQAEQIERRDSSVQEMKTQCFLRLHNPKEAVKAAKKRIQFSSDASGYGLLTQALLADGQTKKAVVAAKKAVQLSGRAIDYGLLTQALLADSQTKKAVVAAKKAVQLSGRAISYYLLSEALRKSKLYEEALEILNKIQSAEFDFSNWLCRAYCFLHLGRHEDAFNALEKARELGQIQKQIYDSTIRLNCGFIFLLEEVVLKNNVIFGELKGRAIEAARTLSAINQEELGPYQKKDVSNALRIARDFKLI